MKLPISSLCPSSSYFLFLTSKFSPQSSAFNGPQSMSFKKKKKMMMMTILKYMTQQKNQIIASTDKEPG